MSKNSGKEGMMAIVPLKGFLEEKKAENLKELLRRAGVTGFSRLRKAELVSLAADTLKNPAYLTRLLASETYEVLSMFEQAIERDDKVLQVTIVPFDDDTDWEVTDRLRVSELVCSRYDPEGQMLYIHPEIAEAYRSIPKEERDGLIVIKHSAALLRNYMLGALNLYGVFDLQEGIAWFEEALKKDKDVPDDAKEDIHDMLHMSASQMTDTGAQMDFSDDPPNDIGLGVMLLAGDPEMLDACEFDGEQLIHYDLLDEKGDPDQKAIAALKRARKDKPRYAPDMGTVMQCSDPLMCIAPETRKKGIQLLQEFLGSKCKDIALDILNELFLMLQENEPMQDMVDYVQDECKRTNNKGYPESESERLMQWLIDLNNNTRLWSNFGHTPNETIRSRPLPKAPVEIHMGPGMMKMLADGDLDLEELKKQMPGMVFQMGDAPAKGKKPGRNDPCPCGSGRKYKNCCGKRLN